MPEVHVPHIEDDRHHPATTPGRTKSFVKLGLEVALITTGVFLGLLGEQWRENAHHRELAKASLERFRAEFRANKAEVNRVHPRHVQEYQGLQKYFADHQAELIAPLVEIRKPLPQPIPDID